MVHLQRTLATCDAPRQSPVLLSTSVNSKHQPCDCRQRANMRHQRSMIMEHPPA
ncbi:hypothetical protein B932_2507 [Gluconobacter oxydans H24]|nr:hypothetical protein B932_2507 [Gluconobacter oxydans H24]